MLATSSIAVRNKRMDEIKNTREKIIMCGYFWIYPGETVCCGFLKSDSSRKVQAHLYMNKENIAVVWMHEVEEYDMSITHECTAMDAEMDAIFDVELDEFSCPFFTVDQEALIFHDDMFQRRH